MNQYPQFALQPPEKTEAPFDRATGGVLWGDTRSFASDMWALSALRFCTDKECSELSGVAERSLRLLQTTGVIHATRAPVGHGTHRRVWHVPEAAVATVLECLRRATGVDYSTIAKISVQAAVIIRMLFCDYVEFAEDDTRDEFDAALILTNGDSFYLQVNSAVQKVDPIVRERCIGQTLPIASVVDGEWKAVTSADQRKRFAAAFDAARFHTVVSLKNVFQQFERDARKMRT